MKKKICFVIQNLNIGGAQRIFIDLINSLHSQNTYDIKLIVLSNENNIFINEINNNIDISILNKKKVIFSPIKLVSQINKYQPEVILSTITNVNILMCLLKPIFRFNFRLIIREANILSMNSKKDFYYLKYILVRNLYKFANKIICISYAVQRDLIDNYKIHKDKTKVIYNPINIKLINQKLNNINNINKITLEIISSKKIIISVGKFSYQKGFDILIKAMKYVKNEEAFLIIMGLGNKNTYHNLINKHNLKNKVILLDYDQNPYILMSKSNLYVCASRFEGFGNTMLEALYLGLPIISTPCHNGTNEIIKNVKYCKIINNFNEINLAKAIDEKFLENNNNYKRFQLDSFNLKSITKEYEKII